MKSEISYRGGKIGFEAVETAPVPNGWKSYTISSGEEVFARVFGDRQITLSLNPQLPYSPDSDAAYDDRTPEQTIVIKEIWDEIRKEVQAV
ncbi:MAG: hypothetical protein EON98_05530 [Chitinophagaceae bacterium]|nr:MAG: hypothetical protein EON98_05530 [Chitinophagaceae bacterium]